MQNKKQCSRQLQCEVSCSVSDVINYSLSSLSSTSHAVPRGGGSGRRGGLGGGGGGLGRGRGQGTFHPPCHLLHYHMVLRPKGTSHNKESGTNISKEV